MLERQHVIHFYEDPDYVLDKVARFLRRSLESGHAAVAVATPSHLETLGTLLAGSGLAVSHLRQQGRFIAVDAAAVCGRRAS